MLNILIEWFDNAILAKATSDYYKLALAKLKREHLKLIEAKIKQETLPLSAKIYQFVVSEVKIS